MIAISGRFLIGILYGESYQPAFEPLLLLLPGTVVLGIGLMLSNEIDSHGKPKINLAISAISVVTNTSLNLLLIPAYGINGTAIASTMTYFLNTALTLLVYSRMTGVRMADIVFIKYEDLLNFTSVMYSVKILRPAS